MSANSSAHMLASGMRALLVNELLAFRAHGVISIVAGSPRVRIQTAKPHTSRLTERHKTRLAHHTLHVSMNFSNFSIKLDAKDRQRGGLVVDCSLHEAQSFEHPNRRSLPRIGDRVWGN